MTNKKVPELRFEGFVDDWEQRKLGEIAEYYDGTHQTPSYTKSGVPFVSVENINDIKGTHKYISEKIFESQFKIKPQKNDIFMTRITAGIIGDTAIVQDNQPLAYYVSLALIRPKEINSIYLEKYFNSFQFKNELHKRIIHTAFPKKINLGEIGQCMVSSPLNKGEQDKIGIFFKQLDTTIALHLRKLELLKKLKRGYLQVLFPQNDEKVPKVRFGYFEENWEQRMLGEEADVRDGTHDSPKYFDMGYPLVTSKNLKSHGLDLTDISLISDNDFEAINKRSKVDKGDILFGMIGTIGNPVLVERDDFAIKNVALIKEQKNVLNRFLIQLLKSPIFDRYIKIENAGGTQKFLALSKIRLFEFKVPSLEEQTRIAGFLDELDNAITHHHDKLQKLQKLKKAFLQKMFI